MSERAGGSKRPWVVNLNRKEIPGNINFPTARRHLAANSWWMARKTLDPARREQLLVTIMARSVASDGHFPVSPGQFNAG
jgi:hypothetical protein